LEGGGLRINSEEAPMREEQLWRYTNVEGNAPVVAMEGAILGRLYNPVSVASL